MTPTWARQTKTTWCSWKIGKQWSTPWSRSSSGRKKKSPRETSIAWAPTTTTSTTQRTPSSRCFPFECKILATTRTLSSNSSCSSSRATLPRHRYSPARWSPTYLRSGSRSSEMNWREPWPPAPASIRHREPREPASRKPRSTMSRPTSRSPSSYRVHDHYSDMYNK